MLETQALHARIVEPSSGPTDAQLQHTSVSSLQRWELPSLYSVAQTIAVVEPYNTVLCVRLPLEHINATMQLSNEAVYDIGSE